MKHAQCESSDQNIITLYCPKNWALKAEFLGVKIMPWLIQSRKYRVVHFTMLILDIQNTFLLTSFKYDRTMPIWSGAKNQLESFFSHCRQNKNKKSVGHKLPLVWWSRFWLAYGHMGCISIIWYYIHLIWIILCQFWTWEKNFSMLFLSKVSILPKSINC